MSTKIVIKTTDRVVPMIYAYTTPEIARHNGWTKIGYTEQDVDKRLSQQTQCRTLRLLTSLFWYPQQEQVWLLGQNVGTLTTTLPAQLDL